MRKREALDLFCCAGGATRGYQRAGFVVTGVDIVGRRNYCGEIFVESDALAYLSDLIASGDIERYSLVHASPPCQAGNTLTLGTNAFLGWGREHQQLIPALHPLLEAAGVPFVIEQPAGHAGIRRDVMLCMDMFPKEPPKVLRHRYFELGGWSAKQPKHPKHNGYVRGFRHGIWRLDPAEAPYVAAYGDGGGKATIAEMQHALGIDWTNLREELTEAIPPDYTQWLGELFLAR
jgi:hypothetical protein